MRESVVSTRRLGGDRSWLRMAVAAVDDRLRRRRGVTEYSRSADCVLRMELGRSDKGLVLSDGALVRPGDRIIDLHLWTEHVPLMPGTGPTLAWAARMRRALDNSLRELTHYLAARPDLSDIAALRGDMGLGAVEHRDQVARVVSRLGFERMTAHEPGSVIGRVRRFGENILICLMILARNPGALREDGLRRERLEGYISVRGLRRRYGLERDRG
jgi:hypothetical protein